MEVLRCFSRVTDKACWKREERSFPCLRVAFLNEWVPWAWSSSTETNTVLPGSRLVLTWDNRKCSPNNTHTTFVWVNTTGWGGFSGFRIKRCSMAYIHGCGLSSPSLWKGEHWSLYILGRIPGLRYPQIMIKNTWTLKHCEWSSRMFLILVCALAFFLY